MSLLFESSNNQIMRYACWSLLALAMLLYSLDVRSEEANNFIEQWQIDKPWKGDLDGMVERRIIRVLVVHNKMMFFFDKARMRGLTYEAFHEFEKTINKQLKTGTRKIKLVFLPVPRDQLLPWLNEGRGDIVAANLTITDGRQALVDFTNPLLKNVKEVLVSGPSAPVVHSVEDLSGKEVHVRASSSYYQHLMQLNGRFKNEGRPPIKLVEVSEYLEDSDLLEMVNAGLIPMVAVDDHKASFWVQVFDKITVHPGITLNSGGKIAWAIRKDSPKLQKALNDFVKKNKKGTMLGNILFKRYLVNNKWARNALSPKEIKRFQELADLFKKYSDQYDFDYLMVAAQAYQESQLDHNRRSEAGAVGIMQLLPSTAADKNVGIPDIDDLENNIHAGVKYLRFLRDRYFSDPAIDPLNQNLFAFASYNAGPAKIRRIRNEAKKMGLDPNVWFGNVEIAAAKKIGRETVQYVSNIYKYYIAYSLTRMRLDAMNKEAGIDHMAF
jgi:membrane-bound lytic murein transglycosylase MltF